MTASRIHNPGGLLIGDSNLIKEVKQDIQISAKGDITVLITGESGVGKDLVAQAIHRHSGRAGKPFLTINCGSVTESLLEAKLFGYVKGAFTGATSNRKGLFEAANGGTVFLDEIGDMPKDLQAHLLRVLQERTIVPVGSHTEIKVDVRVIAATNKDLPLEIAHGRFRQDLYYRLNEFLILVPALRDRPSDIPALVRHFLGSMSIEEEGLSLLCDCPWPGNVRQLKSAIESLKLRASMTMNGLITADQVQRELRLREKIMVAGDPPRGHAEKRQDAITYTFTLQKGESISRHFSRVKLEVYSDMMEAYRSHSKVAEFFGENPKGLHHKIRRWERQINSPSGLQDD